MNIPNQSATNKAFFKSNGSVFADELLVKPVFWDAAVQDFKETMTHAN